MTALATLAVVAFLNVFVLAFQSRNINSGNYVLAALFSMGIGASQAFVWKVVTTTGTTEMLVYSAFGGLGCVAAMKAHQIMRRWEDRKRIKEL